jgi:ketosteroid isomerase-like protein
VRLLTSMLTVAILLLTGAPVSSKKPDLTKVLQQRYSDWMNAFRRADGAAMDKLEADGLMLVMGTGMIWTKEKPRVEELKGVKPARVTHTLDQVRARDQGDVAVLTGIHNEVEADGTKSQSLFTTVWKRENGDWKVWSAHWTDVPPKK